MPNRRPRHPEKSEHSEQVALFEWAALMAGQYPELDLIHATPNAGKRSPRQGARMVAEGLRAGFPDVSLPVGRNGYGALFIEMKIDNNKPTAKQQWWLDKLCEFGNLAVCCWGCDEATEVIMDYLSKGSE